MGYNGLSTEREGGVSGDRDHGGDLEFVFGGGELSAQEEHGDS